MDIKTLALILLIGRLVAIILMTRVVLIQARLIRENNPKNIQTTRIELFMFAIAILLSNFIPVIIDWVAFTSGAGRSSANNPGVTYAMNNMIASNIFALFFTFLYKEAKSGRVMITEEKKSGTN
jgi:hypothetical protein